MQQMEETGRCLTTTFLHCSYNTHNLAYSILSLVLSPL
jgi:hypothetical protein